MSRVGREFFRHVVPQIVKPIRTLWNEMIGFVFLCLAAVPIPRTYRQWRQYDTSGDGLFPLLLSLSFIVIMGSFGLHSFFRARKISRS
jgi:hypothetical protein